MKKLGVGIIGIGEIAQNFHLPVMAEFERAKIVALCDKIKSKAVYTAEKYGAERAVTSVEELLKIDELDAVIIASSTDAHLDIALACMEAGKHLLIERPVARTYEEAKIIADKAAESKSKVMVGMNQRFRFDAKMVKNYVHMNEIGKVFYIKTGWLQHKSSQEWRKRFDKAGGGVLIDLGISLIDSMMWIYDFQPVHSVRASMYHHLTENVEDVCVATIKFKNGSIANLETSWSLFGSKNRYYFNVYGSKGSISVNPLKLYREGKEHMEIQNSDSTLSNYHIYKKSFESQFKHFTNACLGFHPVISTPEEATELMRIIAALYRSEEENREITL